MARVNAENTPVDHGSLRARHPDVSALNRDPLPLAGWVAVVTGASRRDGIGYAIARRMAVYGASLMIHHFRPHDEVQPWGGDDLEDVIAGIRAVLAGPGARVADISADMALPEAPERVMAAAVAEFGHVATDEAEWITGQVISTEGGFARWRGRGGPDPRR
jgi:3-oxoacyl-[acyl-carrier protein] reductase